MKTTELKDGMILRVIQPFKIEKPGEPVAYATTDAVGVVHKTPFMPVFTLTFYRPDRLKGTIYGFRHDKNIEENFEPVSKKEFRAKKTESTIG